MRIIHYVLAFAALAIVCLIWLLIRSRNMALPHNQTFNPIPAAEAVRQLRASPSDDVILAVSHGFGDDDSDFDDVYAAYEGHYEQRLSELTQLLGPPSFEGSWMLDTYPVFAIGERIAVWGAKTDTIYLRIHHEDQEAGIEVSLLSPESPNSNHDSKSIYEENRKFARTNPVR